VSPVVLKAMKKGNLKSFVSGERSRALWALLFFTCHPLTIINLTIKQLFKEKPLCPQSL